MDFKPPRKHFFFRPTYTHKVAKKGESLSSFLYKKLFASKKTLSVFIVFASATVDAAGMLPGEGSPKS